MVVNGTDLNEGLDPDDPDFVPPTRGVVNTTSSCIDTFPPLVARATLDPTFTTLELRLSRELILPFSFAQDAAPATPGPVREAAAERAAAEAAENKKN